jgi:hypothetical protein
MSVIFRLYIFWAKFLLCELKTRLRCIFFLNLSFLDLLLTHRHKLWPVVVHLAMWQPPSEGREQINHIPFQSVPWQFLDIVKVVDLFKLVISDFKHMPMKVWSLLSHLYIQLVHGSERFLCMLERFWLFFARICYDGDLSLPSLAYGDISLPSLAPRELAPLKHPLYTIYSLHGDIGTSLDRRTACLCNRTCVKYTKKGN